MAALNSIHRQPLLLVQEYRKRIRAGLWMIKNEWIPSGTFRRPLANARQMGVQSWSAGKSASVARFNIDSLLRPGIRGPVSAKHPDNIAFAE
jgi:hypothetical protein